jgi:hypothetical protein
VNVSTEDGRICVSFMHAPNEPTQEAAVSVLLIHPMNTSGVEVRPKR